MQGYEESEHVTAVGSADIWLRVLGRAGSTREGRLEVLERNTFQNEPPGNRILAVIQLMVAMISIESLTAILQRHSF
jgi:hypothetical protein